MVMVQGGFGNSFGENTGSASSHNQASSQQTTMDGAASTNNNDVFFFEGELRQLTITLVNPYTGETIEIDREILLNTGSYFGGEGSDLVFLNNQGNALFLVDPNTGDVMVDDVETILGGSGDDIIIMSDLNFTYGNLVIDGGEGDDIIWTNIGNDTVFGGAGDDHIVTGPGNDIVDGGTGKDYINGGTGNDDLSGGDGDDEIYGGEGTDVLNGEDGNDMLYGGDDNDVMDGGNGNDVLYGNMGDDFMFGGSGDDVMYGGNGNVLTFGGGMTSPEDSQANSLGLGQLTAVNSPPFQIQPRDFGDDFMDGGNGDDILYGQGGNDTLIGGAGNDTMYGGTGNDIIGMGLGQDVANGGAGSDEFFFDRADNLDDTIQDFEFGQGGDRLTIGKLLSGFDDGQDDINDFLSLVLVDADTIELYVDADGIPGGDVYKIILNGQGAGDVTLEDLIQDGNLSFATSLTANNGDDPTSGQETIPVDLI